LVGSHIRARGVTLSSWGNGVFGKYFSSFQIIRRGQEVNFGPSDAKALLSHDEVMAERIFTPQGRVGADGRRSSEDAFVVFGK